MRADLPLSASADSPKVGGQANDSSQNEEACKDNPVVSEELNHTNQDESDRHEWLVEWMVSNTPHCCSEQHWNDDNPK